MKKYRLIIHSHPDYDKLSPSADDREFLKKIDQKESLIISYITGEIRSFNQSVFDD